MPIAPLPAPSTLFALCKAVPCSRIETPRESAASHYGASCSVAERCDCRTLKVHDLRSLYMSFVWQCYSCDQTFARTTMHCLGHVSLAESLSYCNVRAEDCVELANAFGPLRLHS